MIYTSSGLPVFKIISGNIKNNEVKLTAYVGPKHNNWENFERTVNEQKAVERFWKLKELLTTKQTKQ